MRLYKQIILLICTLGLLLFFTTLFTSVKVNNHRSLEYRISEDCDNEILYFNECYAFRRIVWGKIRKIN